MRVFLMADAVGCARRAGHRGRLLQPRTHASGALRRGAGVGPAAPGWAARGLDEADLLDGVRAGTMEELSRWLLAADRVVTF